jgi:CheY-like chemotaxis protein
MMTDKEIYILLADDDVEDQEILKDAIMSIYPDLHIESVWNGQEAVDYLSSCTSESLPILIILDYKMPILNAAEVLQRIAEHTSIPKIVWSTSNQPEHISLCMQRGAIKYYIKPNSFSALKDLVKDMFELLNIPDLSNQH